MPVTTTRSPVVLEPASQEFVEATAKPPFLYELTPDEARKVLDGVQAELIDKLPETAPNRGHALTIDSGWREVAEKALAFVNRFA